MAEPRKVGRIHEHNLPGAGVVPYLEVYRCECKKEFFRGKTDKTNDPTWIPLDTAPHFVEYGEDMEDSPLIGRYVPEVQGVPRPAKEENDTESAGRSNEPTGTLADSPE